MSMTRPTTEQITHNGQLLSDYLERAISVKDFGAVGDGVADDLPAFTAAIAEINSRGGGTLYVPTGTYGVDVLVTGSISGTNLAKQIWLCKNLMIYMEPGTLIKALGTWSAGQSYIIFGINNANLYPDAENITIIGNGATLRGLHTTLSTDPGSTHGLWSNNDIDRVRVYDLTFEDFGTCARFEVTNSLVKGCTFLRGENNCVAVTRSSYLTFENCRFSGCIAGGTPGGGSIVEAGVDVEPNATDVCRDITFRNCQFDNNYKYGLYAHQGSGQTYNIIVDGCSFTDNGSHGIAMVGTNSDDPTMADNVVQNCYFEGNSYNAVPNAASLLVGSTRGSTIVNNRIYTDAGARFGLRATFNQHMTVANNVWSGGGDVNFPGIVQVVSDNGGSYDGNIIRNANYHSMIVRTSTGTSISNNTFTRASRELLRIDNNSSGVHVDGNIFADACRDAGNDYIVAFTSYFGLFTNNRFMSSLQYIAGTVSAYTAGPPTTITLGTYTNSQTAYVGEYVRIGSEAIEITAFNTSTGVATLASAFAVAPTPGTSTYTITGPRSPANGINFGSIGSGHRAYSNDVSCSGISVPYFGTSVVAAGNWIDSVRSVTASATAAFADSLILADTTAGNVTITLPTVGSSRALGKQFIVKRMTAGANTLTVAAASGETIDGAASQTIASQYATLRIIGTATGWSVI